MTAAPLFFHTMPASRHLSRVLVLQTLFAYEFHGGDPEALLQYIAQEIEGKNDSVEGSLAFAYELLNGVLRYIPEIRDLISKNAPQWPVEKIAPIDRAALEIGIFELLHSKDVPDVVAIDEAIELAKSFGNESSPKFVNGVLNAILKSKTESPKS